MHTIIHPFVSSSRKRTATPASSETFRQPHYDCDEQADALKLVVYLPGVTAAGIDIEGSGADLTITARKPQVVRVNWQALHLESVQRDYRLKLRLGHGFDYTAMQAEVSNGVLTVTLPKQAFARIGLARVA
ncbi:Hsp20/alpha crystallin family protein [Opitutus sp. ER46]|uniref:Hsp20/alpha crystallin family protein n=1 Tax=Opitutus sp. ER46 TaxID=2161864 RepID=UPI000D2F4F56|nr:Hsp20/alpha crystallin family protein [Opitutus sp. ER46]PTY01072.1 heat-shock protein Hsp20 [Opitutus sp. ER46]